MNLMPKQLDHETCEDGDAPYTRSKNEEFDDKLASFAIKTQMQNCPH